ncbi:hypothetical protein FQZ97_1066410 [compost metagenome]
MAQAGVQQAELVDVPIDKGILLPGRQGLGDRRLETATVEQAGELVVAAGMGDIAVQVADDILQVLLNHSAVVRFRGRNPQPAGGELVDQFVAGEAVGFAALAVEQNVVVGERIGPDQLQILTIAGHQPVAGRELLHPLTPALLGRRMT